MSRIELCRYSLSCLCFFFLNDTAPTEIYTLPLHDALPIYQEHEDPREDEGERERRPHLAGENMSGRRWWCRWPGRRHHRRPLDRKSTRLNSSHGYISDAVFCLEKKKNEGRRRGLSYRTRTA